MIKTLRAQEVISEPSRVRGGTPLTGGDEEGRGGIGYHFIKKFKKCLRKDRGGGSKRFPRASNRVVRWRKLTWCMTWRVACENTNHLFNTVETNSVNISALCPRAVYSTIRVREKKTCIYK